MIQADTLRTLDDDFEVLAMQAQDALDTMRHALEDHKQHKGQDDRKAS